MKCSHYFILIWIGLLAAHPTLRVSCAEPNQTMLSSAALSLTVKDAIVLALQNNYSLQVERYSPEIAQTFVEQERSLFDPAVFADISASETKGQRTSGVGEFRGVTSIDQDFQTGLTKRLQNGIELGLDTRVNKRTSNVFTRLFSTRIGASLTVPVLEGRGSDVNLVGIHQAETDMQISQQELQGFILALISQIEILYWDLYLSHEELKIFEASKFLAEEQLRETRERIQVGALPEIELAAAESEVAVREEAVIDAQSELDSNRLELLARINPPMDSYWTVPVELIEKRTKENLIQGEMVEHIELALQNRPDLNEARLQLERNELQLVRTKNGLLPQLDFFVTYGKTGFASSFSDTFSSFSDNFDLDIGFQFQHRIGKRSQNARHQRTEYQMEAANAAIQNFEQLIVLDIRKAHVEIERYQKQIQATKIATGWQEEKYRAEVEKFRVGKSTNLLVLVAQRDLTQSRLDEIRAQINLRKAASDFYYATGTLTDYHQVVIPNPTEP